MLFQSPVYCSASPVQRRLLAGPLFLSCRRENVRDGGNPVRSILFSQAGEAVFRMTRELRMNGFLISVTEKRIRHLYLRLGKSSEHLRVSVPRGTRDKDILSFVASKIPWIEKHAKRLEKLEIQERKFSETPNTLFLWGERLNIGFAEKPGTKEVFLSGPNLLLPLTEDAGSEERKVFFGWWLGGILEEEIRLLAEKWSGLLGLYPKRILIRPMKTRWGSCTPALGRIRINSLLVHLEKCFLDYVVLHEMIHFLEPSHNARFVSLMDQWMPDWRTLRKKLKENGMKDFGVF